MRLWLALLILCTPALAAPECEDELAPHAALLRLTEVALRNGHINPDDLDRLVAGKITDLKSLGKPLTTENLPVLRGLIQTYNLLRDSSNWNRARRALKKIGESSQKQNELRGQSRVETAPVLRPRLFAKIQIPGPYDPDKSHLSYAADPSNTNGAVAHLDQNNVIHVQDAKGKRPQRLKDFVDAKKVALDIEFGPDGHWRLHVLTGLRKLKYWIVEQGHPPTLVSHLELPGKWSLASLAKWQRLDERHIFMLNNPKESYWDNASAMVIGPNGRRSPTRCRARDKNGLVLVGQTWFCVNYNYSVFQLDDLHWKPVFENKTRVPLSLIDHAGEPWLGFIRRDKLSIQPLLRPAKTFEIKADPGFHIFSHMVKWISDGPNIYSLYFQGGKYYRLGNMLTGESAELNTRLMADAIRPIILTGIEGRSLIALYKENLIEFISIDNQRLGSIESINGFSTYWLGDKSDLTMVTSKLLSDSATDIEFRKVFSEVGE